MVRLLVVTCSLAGVLILAQAGCSSVPPGYRSVEALLEPDGRPIAIVPFTNTRGAAVSLVDRVKLAELTAIQLRAAIPDLRVVGPSGMQELLKRGLNESRWAEIGREMGVELLVVGEITFLEIYHDELLQSREGVIGVTFRVLDVSGFPPRTAARANDLRFSFPQDIGEKFDTQYVVMNDRTFHHELLRSGAQRIARLFYDHLEKERPISKRDIQLRVE